MIELNGIAQVFLGGMLGPVLTELLKLAKWRDKKQIEMRYLRASYWIATCALFLLSGLITVAHGVDRVPLMRAMQLGAAAPLLVGAWASGRNKSVRSIGDLKGRPSLWYLMSW